MPTNEKLILVIDDSPDNQMLLKMLFESRGYQVHCASNGKEALGLLMEMPRLPQLILLDAQMPVMDGYQFRAEQQKLEGICDIPVLIMSGDYDLDMDFKMNHPQGILKKPLQMTEIFERIAELN